MPNYALRFDAKFEIDLENAITYYEIRSKKVSMQFKQGVRKKLLSLKKSPLTGSVRYDDVRLARIERFPYAIHFTVDYSLRLVYIRALFSDFQDVNAV